MIYLIVHKHSQNNASYFFTENRYFSARQRWSTRNNKWLIKINMFNDNVTWIHETPQPNWNIFHI